MNTDYLGDALDLAKGRILRATKPILRKLVTIPMLTDQQKWQDGHHALYAKLLDVPRKNIRMEEEPFQGNDRKEYFRKAVRDIPADAHIFLDPDTGFKKKGGYANKSVRRQDIDTLLNEADGRVVIVYCHRREERGKLEWDLSNCVNQHRCALGYAGKPAMVFFSNKRELLERLRTHLLKWLSPMGEQRLTKVMPDSY